MKRLGAVAVVVVVVGATLVAGCAGGAERGEVLEFGQSLPAGGGMVQSFVIVENAEGEKLTVWLPDDDAVWSDMRAAVRRGGTFIEFESDGDYWRYVGVAEPEARRPATTATAEHWGTLTGKVNASWPLGGGQMTVHSVQVEFDDGTLVDASVQAGLIDSLVSGGRVRAIETPGSEYGWRIVEAEGDDAGDSPVAAPAEGGGGGESPVTAPVDQPIELAAGFISWAPHSYLDDNELTGTGVEVARLVLGELGYEVEEWIDGDRDQLPMMLLAGEIDMVVAGSLPLSPEMPGGIVVSEPIWCLGELLLTAPGNPLGLSDYASIAESGAVVGFIEEDPNYPGWLEAAGVAEEQIVAFPFMDIEAYYGSLAVGDIDVIAIVSSLESWGDFAPQETEPGLELTEVFFPPGTDPSEMDRCYSFGFNDSDLRDTFNEELARLQASGAVGDILVGFGIHQAEIDKATD